MKQCPVLSTAGAACREFELPLRSRQSQLLDQWLTKTTELKSAPEMRRFALGLRDDLPAVEAEFSMPWSNGPVEGEINRLKLIKRQMYGRAKFDLLQRRVLFAG